ncbi:hypothetical protein [Micromonospora sp. WMMD737]|uniref:hypothetical protein n=1 Tax=Micromonospora sp. WMMD737 TaxID=3404113 RepID=UPI003B9348AD
MADGLFMLGAGQPEAEVIQLDFSVPKPGSAWRETWRLRDGSDPATVSEMDLRYKYFGAQVDFAIDDMTVISKVGHVTLVDLALALRHAEGRLSSGEDAAFGFTESSKVVRLEGPGPVISVRPSVSSESAQVSRQQLVPALATFRESVYQRLIVEVPGLEGNPTIQKLRSPAS